jgi:hypothetical protein
MFCFGAGLALPLVGVEQFLATLRHLTYVYFALIWRTCVIYYDYYRN